MNSSSTPVLRLRSNTALQHDRFARKIMLFWCHRVARLRRLMRNSVDDEPASDQRTNEEALLYQAATHPENISNIPADNASFFGTARTKQLHGAGSVPPPENMDDDKQMSS